MIIDLHSHTLFSDGSLTPSELLNRAIENHVDVMAITDHDTLDAYREIPKLKKKITLVPGIELSTQWENTGIHVLGLNFDLGSAAIHQAAAEQTGARMLRANRIAEKLTSMGVENALDGALQHAPSDYLGRPHFAQHIVASGKAPNLKAAFKKYLGAGKPGDIKSTWADLAQVIQWIRDANGIAVLAHPLKYPLTRSKLKRLLTEFKRLGGQGMEVVSGQQNPDHTRSMTALCQDMKLLASCGSDFHHPDTKWADLGRFTPLPAQLEPVWDHF